MEVTGIVIRDPVFPASKCDSDPLERERPYGGVVARTALALLFIIGTGPVTVVDRMAGPFLECRLEICRAKIYSRKSKIV